MKYNSLIKIIILCISLTLAKRVGSSHYDAQSLSPQGQALYDLFFNANCQALCFLGVESLITTEQELIDWLVAQNLQFSVDTSGPVTIVYWQPPDRQFLLSQTWVLTTVPGGVVEHIVADIDVPVKVVFEVFGSPDQVTIDDVIGDYDTAYLHYLVYQDLGLAFMAGDFPYDGTTTFFSLSWPGNGFTWSELPPGEPLTQTCTTYGVPPCIAPTATMTPHIPTPINTPTPECVLGSGARDQGTFHFSCCIRCTGDIEWLP
jgi:hypothetical protein